MPGQFIKTILSILKSIKMAKQQAKKNENIEKIDLENLPGVLRELFIDHQYTASELIMVLNDLTELLENETDKQQVIKIDRMVSKLTEIIPIIYVANNQIKAAFKLAEIIKSKNEKNDK